jgi:quercetin dioxygenase-like cupin family protein
MADIERHVLRFADLPGHESPWQPADMAVAKYDRKRYGVVGRPNESAKPGAGLDDVKAFNITYLRCEPGTGLGTHGHATPEVFIVMAGTWRITMGPNGEQATILKPFDIVSVPPDAMHGATNVGDEVGWIMTVNAGHGGAKIVWGPDVLAELAAAGKATVAAEQPGVAKE